MLSNIRGDASDFVEDGELLRMCSTLRIKLIAQSNLAQFDQLVGK